jgi:hypothetical protein
MKISYKNFIWYFGNCFKYGNELRIIMFSLQPTALHICKLIITIEFLRHNCITHSVHVVITYYGFAVYKKKILN